MGKIIWSARFSVGVKAFDSQHKKIFEIINQLVDDSQHDSASENFQAVLEEMKRYTLEHLQYEEQLLSENNYPAIDVHTEQHGYFIDRLNDFLKDDVDNQKTADLLAFLQVWWVRHILEEDMKYKPFFKLKGIE